jgi:hypothetical protein
LTVLIEPGVKSRGFMADLSTRFGHIRIRSIKFGHLSWALLRGLSSLSDMRARQETR